MKDIQDLWGLFNHFRYREAIKKGEQKLKTKPHDAEIMRLLGMSYDQLALKNQGEKKRIFQKQAACYFKKILKENPKSMAAYRGLGLVSLHQNKLDEALSYYQKVRRLNPQDPNTFISVGNVYKAQKKIMFAKKWYAKAEKRKETKLVALVNETLLCQDLGDLIQAKKYARKALVLIKRHKLPWMAVFEEKLRELAT
ncbi:MAG: tetratricopeptide repeat protein [bacterium]|nr:tetratricopeptide repeat protein [bacterium]